MTVQRRKRNCASTSSRKLTKAEKMRLLTALQAELAGQLFWAAELQRSASWKRRPLRKHRPDPVQA